MPQRKPERTAVDQDRIVSGANYLYKMEKVNKESENEQNVGNAVTVEQENPNFC